MTESNKKIVLLIVEDEKVLSSVLEERLVEEGYSVIKATNGAEGLQLAFQKHPDLILLDILMPQVDGLTMFKKIRNDPWGKSVAVIFLTNVDNSEKIYDAMSINDGHGNMFEYIVKTSIPLEGVVTRIKKRLESIY